MTTPDDFRSGVRAALEARLTSGGGDTFTVLGAGSDDLEAGRAYLRALAGGGWAVPTWPAEYGGLGATPAQAGVVAQELARFDVPDLYPYLIGLAIAGPTLVAHATPEQCSRWLPAIRTGDDIWCQLFSEPDAGSDLASLATRAERDGDQWRVTGSKVWTSRAHYSQWGLLLARTDPNVPKHAGITAFALDMHAPGVTVSPLRQMNGDTHFSEVHFDDAPVADADRIDAPGDGWRVARTALTYERGAGAVGGGGWGADLKDRLVDLARRRSATTDPLVRQQLAATIIELEVARLTARRARDAAKAGRSPGPEGSGSKLRGSAGLKAAASLALVVLGPDGIAGIEGDGNAEWETLFLTSPSISIRGGTDEIQRNIVGERVLGLPSEPRADVDVPFADLPRTARRGEQ
ncbi:MAG TPA: acyl-CoA dehydrogenase family protein [Acidimicrobiia bacterium]|nr:acyl-CoA dehydrogenase family protein [Acidimicrobiia bacterium]